MALFGTAVFGTDLFGDTPTDLDLSAQNTTVEVLADRLIVRRSFAGDSNANGSMVARWRATSTSAWSGPIPMTRLSDRFEATILLPPGTYDAVQTEAEDDEADITVALLRLDPLVASDTVGAPDVALALVRQDALVASDPPAPQPTTISHWITWYGYPDNDPPGTAIAYPAGGQWPTIHTQAGGVGTYADPVTVASDPNEWKPGTRFYFPFIQKYGIMEDYCQQCVNDWVSSARYHVDIWMGGDSTSGAGLVGCQNTWTRQDNVEVNPPEGRTVDTSPMWNETTDVCRGSAPAPAPAPSGWVLTFEDHFTSPTLNRNVWATTMPWGSRVNHANRDNEEPQFYDDRNVIIDTTSEGGIGICRLVCKAETVYAPEVGRDKYYTSGVINSAPSGRPGFSQRYGLFQSRMKQPNAVSAMWPAFWLLWMGGADGFPLWVWPPEIDIHEYWGIYNSFTTNPHLGDGPHGTAGRMIDGTHAQQFETHGGFDPPVEGNWHVYELEWSPGLLIFRLDGNELTRSTGGWSNAWGAPGVVPDVDMYMLINFALEPNKPITNQWPQYYEIDWVRVFRKA